MQQQHNRIVKRLKARAIFMNWRVHAENQVLQQTHQPGRPDLVLEKNNALIIVDVTCHFEMGQMRLKVLAMPKSLNMKKQLAN